MLQKFFQDMILQFKDIIGRTVGVINNEGRIISCSDLSMIGEVRPVFDSPIFKSDEAFIFNGYSYKIIASYNFKTEFTVFVKGDDNEAARFASIFSISLTNMKSMYDDKYDKTAFIKNVVLDNILPNDVYIKSRELRMESEIVRVVFLIKFSEKTDLVPVDIVQNMFPARNRDYVLNIAEKDIVLVKELPMKYDQEHILDIAKQIVGTINAEFYSKVMVGIGSVVTNLKDLSRSYKEAIISIEIGRIFENDKCIIDFENLGIGRLIYQLPTTLCEIFLQEVFKKGMIESLDKESFMTIQCFFENNLNVSETSRKLFVHRNTLVYRLEKIKKLTGLDLREFEHAITFKVALMVRKYLMSKPVKY